MEQQQKEGELKEPIGVFGRLFRDKQLQEFWIISYLIGFILFQRMN